MWCGVGRCGAWVLQVLLCGRMGACKSVVRVEGPTGSCQSGNLDVSAVLVEHLIVPASQLLALVHFVAKDRGAVKHLVTGLQMCAWWWTTTRNILSQGCKCVHGGGPLPVASESGVVGQLGWQAPAASAILT